MACSMILVNNSVSSIIDADSTIPIGSAIHGYGSKIKLNGNSILINDKGHYSIDSSFVVSPSGGASTTIQLYVNGVPVSGAYAITPLVTSGNSITVSVPWVVYKGCCGEPTLITFKTTEEATILSATVRVIKT